MKTVILAMPPKLERIGTHGDFGDTIKLVEGQDVVKQRVNIQDGKVIEGQEVIDFIASHPDDTFVVSMKLFEHLKGLGCKNISMWDNKKTIYDGKTGFATSQGGLIFA